MVRDKIKTPGKMRELAAGLLRSAARMENKQNELNEPVTKIRNEEPSRFLVYKPSNVIRNDNETVKPMEKTIASLLGAKIGRTGYLEIESNGKTHIKDGDNN